MHGEFLLVSGVVNAQISLPSRALVVPAPGTYIVTASSAVFGCSTTRTYTLGTSALDTDGDGVLDCLDNCPTGRPGRFELQRQPGLHHQRRAQHLSCICAGTFKDTDGDGVCDASDNCPGVVGQIGSSCNDGNANTISDILSANCIKWASPYQPGDRS